MVSGKPRKYFPVETFLKCNHTALITTARVDSARERLAGRELPKTRQSVSIGEISRYVFHLESPAGYILILGSR